MNNIANIDAQRYVDSLPSTTRLINLSNKNITILPDLSRFPNLHEVNCSHNLLIMLPALNESIQEFFCNNNMLTSLPKLPDNLKCLYCFNNRLTSLPKLNNTLRNLYCYKNKLTKLPPLNDSLRQLYCCNNNLTILPLLNDGLQTCYSNDNPIYDILINYNNHDIDIIRNVIKQIHSFNFLYYSLKYKNKFRNLLWVRIREPKIKEKYSPENLNKLLNNMVDSEDEEEFQNILNTW